MRVDHDKHNIVGQGCRLKVRVQWSARNSRHSQLSAGGEWPIRVLGFANYTKNSYETHAQCTPKNQ